MGIYRRSLVQLSVAVGVLGCVASSVQAQAYPSRPVTVIINSPAGSLMEGTFRTVMAEASKVLGQPLVVENRAGANGRLGVMALKSAAPDGHTITIANDAIMITQPVVDPTFQMELGKDYQPIAFLGEFPLVLAARPDVPFKDLKGLVAYAKANPGKLNWAVTPGNLFITEMARQTAGIEFTAVPYKGSTSSFVDIVGGRVDLVFAGVDVATFFKAGKMIGVGTTGNVRWGAFPDLATFSESGFPVVSTVWYGLLAHAATPPEVVAKLSDAFNVALRQPAAVKQLESNGFITGRVRSPKDLAAFIQSEVNVWRPVIQKATIKLN
jgi:tripartite-type tricarboxylate transporter receptor subunit TctC